MRDLGVLEGPVLLFGGPYSNLHATRALIGIARERGIPAERMICTGDVCAYAADAEETAKAVRTLGCPVVMGNCEESLGTNSLDCGCGFEEGAACDAFAVEWFSHANREISGESRAWMRDLPRRIVFKAAGRRYAVIHGGASRINAFVWPSDPAEKKAAEISLLEQELGPLDGVICGHTGVGFVEKVGSHQWINAGAIGLPPHDGDPRTAYAILEDGEVTLHRLEYDFAGASKAMETAGLTSGYHRSLACGWWPSEDTFPPEMRHGRTALSPV